MIIYITFLSIDKILLSRTFINIVSPQLIWLLYLNSIAFSVSKQGQTDSFDLSNEPDVIPHSLLHCQLNNFCPSYCYVNWFHSCLNIKSSIHIFGTLPFYWACQVWSSRMIHFNTYFLPAVLYGMKLDLSYYGKDNNWGHLRKKCRGKYLDLWRRKLWKVGEDCIKRSFITCMIHQIILGWSNQGGWDVGVYHTWERWKMPTKFWLETQREETTQNT